MRRWPWLMIRSYSRVVQDRLADQGRAQVAAECRGAVAGRAVGGIEPLARARSPADGDGSRLVARDLERTHVLQSRPRRDGRRLAVGVSPRQVLDQRPRRLLGQGRAPADHLVDLGLPLRRGQPLAGDDVLGVTDQAVLLEAPADHGLPDDRIVVVLGDLAGRGLAETGARAASSSASRRPRR